MKIIGFKKSDFVAKDGTQVKGINVYLEEPIQNNGKGTATDKFYLSDAKAEKMGINVEALIGKEVKVTYNRWGKVDFIKEVNK